MKRITLTLMALLAATRVVAAQDPTPPARPLPAPRPARPVEAGRPVYTPMAPIPVVIDAEHVREMAEEAARMNRIAHLPLAAALVAAAANASAQIASRVDGAPDGRVQFTFASRPGVCGNGRTYIQTGPNSITGSFSYNGNFYGNYSDGMGGTC